jgi:hypothetical protein
MVNKMITHQSTVGKISAAKTPSVEFRHSLVLAAKFLVTFVVMLIAFIASWALIDTGVRLPPEEAGQSGPALLIVSLIDSLVLGYLILRSRWHGVKLMAAVVVVHFGVQTFMSQIETLFFIGALKIPMDIVRRIIAAGFLRALIFAPLAVIVFGKLK